MTNNATSGEISPGSKINRKILERHGGAHNSVAALTTVVVPAAAAARPTNRAAGRYLISVRQGEESRSVGCTVVL